MSLVACSECLNPVPDTALAEGVCYACLRKREPDTEETRRARKIQEAVEMAARTRAERAVIAEELNPQPRPKPKVPQSPSAPPPAEGPKTREQELIEQELARRALARKKLLPFVMRFNESYHAGWVHKIICEELERFEAMVVDRKSPRLIIEVPPRHGKSELVSRMFPSWFLMQLIVSPLMMMSPCLKINYYCREIQ